MFDVKEFSKTLTDYLITFDDFTVIKTIGRGGFGEVYLAEHKASGVLCALKKLTMPEEDFHRQEEKYFIREVDILSKANNPFLLYLLGFSDHYPYCIATEFIPNGSLFDALHHKPNSPTLNGTDLTICAYIIATCIQSLHEKNIVHRNIKALSVLLDNKLLPHVCDFGIFREDDFLTTAPRVIPNWMAPELFGENEYSNKVDVYAYGMLLWEMLTGEIPFAGKQPFIIMQEIMKGERPKIPDETPLPLKLLIQSCWTQKPEDRPTFANIVKLFKNHKVAFAECDDSRFDAAIQFTKKIKPVSITRTLH